MSATLLILIALAGADPNVVFTNAAPRVGQVTPHRRWFDKQPSVQSARKPSNRPAFLEGLTTARTQSDRTEGAVLEGIEEEEVAEEFDPELTPSDSLWDHVLVQEFVSGMNPFAAEEVRTLEGYYDPFGSQGSYGTSGYQPFRLGWISYNDLTLLPVSAVHGGATKDMKILESNTNVRVSHVIAPGVIFNGTGWFNARWWDGPNKIALPGQVDQVSADIELGFFNEGPWSGQVAFHPQIVETFEARLNRYAFNFDGRAIAMYRASSQWSFVGGVAIWDRVDLLVVPHVGVIWSPNDRWELRLLFPKSRISYYLGQWRDADFWLYGVAEYTAEAWQANLGKLPNQVHDRIQLTDDRVSLGLRWDRGRYSFFTEGGYVFDRRVKFVGPTPNFTIGDIGMIRVGVRY